MVTDSMAQISLPSVEYVSGSLPRVQKFLFQLLRGLPKKPVPSMACSIEKKIVR